MLNKNILLAIDNGFTARSFLQSDFLDLLKKEFKKVVIVAPEVKLDFYKKLYGKDNVIIEKMQEKSESWLRQKFCFLLKYSIPTYQAWLKLMRNLFTKKGFRFSSWVIYFPFVLLSWVLARFKFWRKFLRWIFHFFKPDPFCFDILKKHQIDLVIANYTGIAVRNFNLKLFVAAKRLKILTIGNIATWDQFSSKVFITSHTDFITVPNEEVKKEAIELGDFKESQIKIVGVPHFDFYFKKEMLQGRNEFFGQIGADVSKKLIFFGGALEGFDVNYSYFLEIFNLWTKNELNDCQFYLRPHPKSDFSKALKEKYVSNHGLIFENKENALKFSGNFEIPQEDESLLFNLIFHCDVLIHFFSTLMIEACLMQKPVISMAYYGKIKQNFFYKADRDMQREHLHRMFKLNFCKFPKFDQELLDAIKDYLKNPALYQKERNLVAKKQIFFMDGTAAEKFVDVAVEIAKNYATI